MTTYAMPSLLYGSPKDFDKWFWRTYHEGLLEYLHAACDPDGQEAWIKRQQARTSRMRGIRAIRE